MKTQHTQGEWRYVRYETTGGIVFHRVMCGNICIYEGDEQYARLIAAAPKLLEALEDIIYRSSIDASGVPFIESSIKERALAAIATAKGE